jgi:hypothetical protein
MSNPVVASGIRRYEAKATVEVGGKKKTVTTGLRIEAAGPITLTQLEAAAGQAGKLFVPPTSNLTVLGDTVTIEGTLKLPGRLVKIMARRIEARPRDGSADDPAINVDGAELDADTKDPKPLLKGATPDGMTPGTKRAKGTKGKDATSNRIEPGARDYKETPGEIGWSAVDHPSEMNGEDGKDGAPGNPGGGILLVCKELVLAGSAKTLGLSARGGPGGNGQKGQDAADGGDGGEPFDARDGVGFASAGFMTGVPGGPGGAGGNGGRGGRAGAGGNGGIILIYMEVPTIVIADLRLSKTAGDRGRPGDGGKRGEGGFGARAATGIKSRFVPEQPKRTDGKPGKEGDSGGAPERDGVDGTHEVKSGPNLTPALLSTMSVRQLAMMADRVRAVYLGLGPEAADVRRAAVLEQMEWLKRLLEWVPTEDPEFPIARAAIVDVIDAKGYLEAGLDWFGNGRGFVPSVSVGTLRGRLDRQLAAMGSIEEESKNYEQALIDQKDATSTLQTALTLGDAQLSEINAAFAATHKKLVETEGKIKDFEGRRNAARQPLQASLVGFGTTVQATFGLSAETLFNAMSQLAFTSPENPAGAALMGLSQAGTIFSDGMKNIVDETGRPIEKGYILGEIKRLSSPDLSTDLKGLADGRYATQATYRAIAEYDKVKQLIARFATNTSNAQDAIDQINHFIEIVAERNRQVEYYNDLLEDLVQLNALQRRVRLSQQISHDALSRADPTLDEAAGYFSALNERVKQDCLQALYLLHRAQCFWSLDRLDGFSDMLGTSPVGIRHGQIAAAASRVETMLTDSLERFRRTPNRFPERDKRVGFPVVLTRSEHGFIFEALQLIGSARFRIAPATGNSRAPEPSEWVATRAVTPCDKLADPDGPNPFHGKADVRLTKVRVWLIGFKTRAARHTVTLHHLGSELLCTPANDIYPPDDGRHGDGATGGRPRINHAELKVPFSYSPDGLRGPEGFHPGRLDVDGAQDGDLGFSGNVGLGLGSKDCYAAVGPFADWRLVVRERDNPGADWGGCHTIVLDFHGFHQTF